MLIQDGERRSFAIGCREIELREDVDGKALRCLTLRLQDGSQARRLLALTANYDEVCRNDAAAIGGLFAVGQGRGLAVKRRRT